MADVFLSYAGEDRGTAAALASCFEIAGWSVWWDRELASGDAFANVIQDELDAARCVVVLWSHAAAQSKWVTAESQRAFDAEKVVPIRLDELALPLPISMIQSTSLAGWDGTLGADGLAELMEEIARHQNDSELVATAPCPLFRCAALGDWGVASGGQDSTIRVWSLHDGRLLRELDGHGDLVAGVAWDGADLLASGSADRTARIWSLSDQQSPVELVGHGAPVDDVAFTHSQDPGGGQQAVITVSADRTVRWWDLTGTPIKSVAVSAAAVCCAGSEAHGVVAVGTGDGAVGVWRDGEQDRILTAAHHGSVLAVEFSADAANLLTTGVDGMARIWDLENGELRTTLRGHRGPVLAGAFDADQVITGSSDGSVRFWDASSGEQLRLLSGISGGAPGVDTTTGRTVVITSMSGQVRRLEQQNAPARDREQPTAASGGTR